MSRLRRCTIEAVGLIARAEVSFADGLTVFTGETGSGKTMVLGALNLALGGRAFSEVVARDASAARATLEFEPDAALRARFEADGFEIESDEDASFVREVQAGGKSSARINGRPATAAQLRAYGETLVDFVGQHEAQRLLSGSYQSDLLDRFCGEDALAVRDRVASGSATLNAIDERLRELEASAGRALAEAEFARFAASEIESARLDVAEEGRLRERRDYLANAERIAGALRTARGALVEHEGAASEGIGAAAAALAAISRVAEPLAKLAERASALQDEVSQLSAALGREEERTEFDPAENEETGARLDAIERLKKKYGGSIPAVLEAGARYAATAAAYDARDERSAVLRSERSQVASKLEADAGALTALRTKGARRLEQRVGAELSALAMKHARFEVALEPQEQIGPRGHERIEFTFAPNRGEPARSLGRAASGGELSRVLLALVVVLAELRESAIAAEQREGAVAAEQRDGAVLVFDEIDAGVGGATAKAVAQRLSALARSAQVLCVTHLAQIAACADEHVALRKHETKKGTRIEAVALGRDEILPEVARMLSGSAEGVALEHAASLLRESRPRAILSEAG